MERPVPGDGSVPEESAAAGSGVVPGGAAAVSSIEQGEKQKKVRAQPTCSVCNSPGHTKTTCPRRMTESGDSPVAGAADGTKSAASPEPPKAVDTKEVAANTAKSLRQSANDFKVAREEANKKELRDYEIYHCHPFNV
jgi:hypothetical protein